MAQQNELKRHIGFWGAIGIGVGAIVGGGILALAGVAFAASGPSAIIAFTLNGIIAFITAKSFADMSAAFPESGGAYTFTKKVLSVRAAFAVGWILWFASIMAGVLYAMGFASYGISAIESICRAILGYAPAWLNSRPVIILLSIGAISFYTILLLKKSGGGEQWESVGKVILFFVLILAGFWVLSGQRNQGTSLKLTPFFGGGLFGILQTMGFTFITLQGFDLIPAVASEIKNPQRNIPLAIFVSLSMALAIYLPFLFIISTAGVPAGQSIISLARANPETLVAISVSNFLGPIGYWIVIIAAILSMLSALYANMLAASRIALAMSADRTLPRFLGIINKSTGTPQRALCTTSGILIFSILAIPNLAAAGAAASLVFLISFTLTHITTLLAKIRGGLNNKGSMEIIKGVRLPVLPLLGAICCGSLALFQGISVPSAGKVVSIWLALGFIIYFSILSSQAQIVDARWEAKDPTLIRLRGRSPLVLVPLANPAHAKAMVEVANALSPPEIGRALLLSIVAGEVKWSKEAVPPQLNASQDALREALIASYTSALAPEALITVATKPWPEILRVASLHRCESLLIGLGETAKEKIDPEIEKLIVDIDSDIVFLKAAPDWQLSNTKRILVPVGGKSDHDELRARLLNSLCRGMERAVTFLRVVPADTTTKELKLIQQRLTRLAEDEIPINSRIEVVRNDNIIDAVKSLAQESDLLILGIQRFGPKKKVFGDVALKITQSIRCATILISRKG